MSTFPFWLWLTSILTTLVGLAAVLLLVNCWRFSRCKSTVLLLCLTPLPLVATTLCFLWVPLLPASYLVMVINLLSMLLILMLTPWRQGRLLFILLSVYAMLFVLNNAVSVLFAEEGALSFGIRFILWMGLLFFLWRFFRPTLIQLMQSDIFIWYRACLLPVLVTAVYFVFLLSFALHHRWQRPDWLVPGDSTWAISLLLFLLLAALPLCIFTAFYQFFLVFNRQYLHRRDVATMSAQLKTMLLQEEDSRQDEAHDAEWSVFLINLLDALEDATRRGEYQSARLLLGELDSRLESAGQHTAFPYTGHPLVDTVLTSYAELAQRDGIAFTIALQPPPAERIDMTGLAVVLSNALENAVTASLAAAARKAPVISLTGGGTPAQYCMELRNTCLGVLTFDPVTGCPCTQEVGHGYGTRSIAAFAQDHGGSARFSMGEGWFILRMLL